MVALAAVLLGALGLAVVVRHDVSGKARGRPAPTSTVAGPTGPVTTAAVVMVAAAPLVPWSGPIEHLFFHTLVIDASLAFAHDRLGQGFRDYFVTVSEFRSILGELDAKGWTLVDIHRAIAGSVRVPPGRKPFVLSEDDVNYYDYERPRGLGWRLVLDGSGAVKVEVHDVNGIRVTDEDLVPILDEFVGAHPEFSADGARGVLALTGFQGSFGERTQDRASPEWAASVARATAVAGHLKATGWTLASHSYGHVDLTRSTTERARTDTERWKAEVEPITGPTNVYVYAFGAAPPTSSRTVQLLREQGFTVLCDIDVVPRVSQAGGVAVMSRRHIDGLAFAQQAGRLAPLFDVATVEDHRARSA